jgi:hypothetical protein
MQGTQSQASRPCQVNNQYKARPWLGKLAPADRLYLTTAVSATVKGWGYPS